MTRNQIIRKTLYAIVAAVLGVLAIFGIVTAEQADQWTSTAQQVLEVLAPLAGSASLTLAATKVHRGSDSRVTKDDLKLAESKAQLRPDHGQPVVAEPLVESRVGIVDEDTLGEAARAFAQATRQNMGEVS